REQCNCGLAIADCGLLASFRNPKSAIRNGTGGRKEQRLFVELYRGKVLESRHTVHVAVVDSSGRLAARAGNPDLSTFWRSAAKPFQALPLVEDGADEHFKLTRQDLALACASHSSEPAQVALV